MVEAMTEGEGMYIVRVSEVLRFNCRRKFEKSYTNK